MRQTDMDTEMETEIEIGRDNNTEWLIEEEIMNGKKRERQRGIYR